DDFALRDEAKRRKITRAGIGVFEEVAVDLQFVEQHFGDWFIAALRTPGALEVAAAKVHANRHAGWTFRDRRIDQPRVSARQLVRVVATLPRAFPHLLVAQIC